MIYIKTRSKGIVAVRIPKYLHILYTSKERYLQFSVSKNDESGVDGESSANIRSIFWHH